MQRRCVGGGAVQAGWACTQAIACELLLLGQSRHASATNLTQARARDDLDAAAGGSDSGSDAGGAAGFGPPPATPTAVEICHAEEASCLLRDLARCSDEVAALVAEREVPLARGGSACAIM